MPCSSKKVFFNEACFKLRSRVGFEFFWKFCVMFAFGLSLYTANSSLVAQSRCSTMEYLKKEEKLTEVGLHSFEKWLEKRLRHSHRKSTLLGGDSLLVIPVIIHIVHNGEEKGVNENISASQVYSQFEILNQDYGRMNADRFNTPSLFKNIASDTKIEFRPALVSPDSMMLEEPGIHRVAAEREEWTASELDNEIKPATSWDPNRYLNIWVADLQGSTLGYSSWPKEPGIIGVPQENAPPEEEGVVVSYHVFGSNYTSRGAFEQLSDSRYDRGRTTTHEMGHYFGLLHPWGFTGGCGDDDFCDDTPTTSRNRDDIDFPCSFPDEQNTCSDGSSDLPDMFQNFMDYTADQCMNLFTSDQTDRMRAVITGAPRRASLLTAQVILPHAAPSSLSAVSLNDSVVSVTWAEKAANAATYAIERSDSPAGTFTQIGQVDYGTSIFYDTLPDATTGYYRVKAENLAGASNYSAVVFSGEQAVPSAPSNLEGLALTSDSVQLSWEIMGNAAEQLVLEWSFDAESGFQVGRILSPDITQVNLRGLLDGQIYYFRVKAENTAGSSDYSNTLAVEMLPYPPAAPQSLVVSFLPDIRKFELSWLDDGEEITAYRIYRAEGSTESFEEVAITEELTPIFIDSELEVPPNAQFFYLVRAENEGGISGYSNIAEFDAITGNQENLSGGSILELFPNPANQYARFVAKRFPTGKVRFNLFSLAGKRVWNFDANHTSGDLNVAVPLESLNGGLYFLHITHKSKTHVLKLLVE